MNILVCKMSFFTPLYDNFDLILDLCDTTLVVSVENVFSPNISTNFP